MLTRRIRERIEWHFLNYDATKTAGEAEFNSLSEYAESGLAVSFGGFKGMGGKLSNPTESAFFKYQSRLKNYYWEKVVRYTWTAFRFEAEYDTMQKRYEEYLSHEEIIGGGLEGSTYWYRRDKWLLFALRWAKEFGLL